MRIAIRIVQIFVGLLFIVSGLVKANDPIGLGYKMQEFFELWSAGATPGSFLAQTLHNLHEASLALSVAMITLEIMAGVALLLGWKKKFILWLLLLLIIFFTFLTGYAYLSGKFTNCGCFGDCIPITPFTSFLKDVVLLVMILFLLVGQRYIRPILSATGRSVVLLVTLIFSLGLQWYVLNYLPIMDCLPFKKGNNIAEKMKAPPGAVPDSFAIRFIYEKGGKQYEFAPENLPADFTTYKFIDRKQTLVRKGNAKSPINDFSLVGTTKDSITGNTIDSTQIILSQPKVLLIFALDFKDASWVAQTKELLNRAKEKKIPVYVLSPNVEEAAKAFHGMNNLQFFNTDFTVVRTVARTNPTILLLGAGTVEQKWSKKEINKAVGYVASMKS